MLSSDTLQYPYDVQLDDDGRYRATLVDLPQGPYGFDYNPDSAVKQLIQAAIPVLNDLRVSGRPVNPSAVEGKKTIMVGPMMALNGSRPSAEGDIRASRDSLVYGWTEGSDSRKK